MDIPAILFYCGVLVGGDHLSTQRALNSGLVEGNKFAAKHYLVAKSTQCLVPSIIHHTVPRGKRKWVLVAAGAVGGAIIINNEVRRQQLGRR